MATAPLVTQSGPARDVFPTARWPSPREQHRISSQRTAGRPTLVATLLANRTSITWNLMAHPFIYLLVVSIG